MPLKIELSNFLIDAVLLEDPWALLLLRIGLQYPLSFLFWQEFLDTFVQSTLVVIENVQRFNHFCLEIVIPQNNSQFQCFPRILPSHFIVICPGIHLLNRNTDKKSEFFEVKLSRIVLPQSIILDLSIVVSIIRMLEQLVVQKVEN